MQLCPHRSDRRSRRTRAQSLAFTLIELLVVVAIIGLLVSVLVPSLGAARRRAQSVRCLSHLRVFGHGSAMYLNNNNDVLMPSRLPKLPGKDCDPWADIYGRQKYRPTFVAAMSTAVGAPPFDDPMACKSGKDMHGEPGDKQNYSYEVYVCPTVRTWVDERNGAYGYNYQFLGNSRLFTDADTGSYKNWPVPITRIRYPGSTVMAGDCMGTAASWPTTERWEYLDNAGDAQRYGNEGFNLDPPWVDGATGEMANGDSSPQSRSAADPRHAGKANILWADGHGSGETLAALGYTVAGDGVVEFEGVNALWTGSGRDEPWTITYEP